MRARSFPWPLLLLFPYAAACGGTPAPADDAGSDAAHDAAPACRMDSECDDGLVCNGVERCASGVCASGTPMRCDDGIGCTIDSCSEALAHCVFRVPDEDGDGSGSAACVDGTGTPLGDDCDDTDPHRYAGATEICDAASLDEDCDPTTLGGRDDDHDGYVSALCCNGASCGDDCDDTRETVHPGATETCNHLDDNCDGSVDEGVSVAGFVDADRDGYGDASMPITACGTAVGFSAYDTDCDDTNAAVHPAQTELCDGIDNDCDPATAIDENATSVTWYRDADGDGFGTTATTMVSCAPPTGYAILGTDCDDASAGRNPGTAELCNGVDDDCNGTADYVISPGDLEDDDQDGVPDAACHDPRAADCDDRDPTSGPGSLETCDGRDNDCDGAVDEGATSVAFYRDADGDGFGSSTAVAVACVAPAGFVRRGGDCDDAATTRFPGALESCDAIDNDCDSAVDEGSYASQSCAGLHASGQCVLGTCRTAACDTGYADCVAAEPGCESDILNSAAHCGSCSACPPGGSCVSGSCVITCAPFSSCDAHNPCSWNDNCGATGVCAGTIVDCGPVRVDAYAATATALGGPGTGTTNFDDVCPTGLLPIGIEANIAAGTNALTEIALVCGAPTFVGTSVTFTPSVRMPATGGETCCTTTSGSGSASCPSGSVVVGFQGSTSGGAITELALRCAPIVVGGTAATTFTMSLGATVTTSSIGTPGGTPISATSCAAGSVASGMYGTGGTSLDAFGLHCSPPALRLGTTAPEVGSAGTTDNFDCPIGQVPIGWSGATTYNYWSGTLAFGSFQCGYLETSLSGTTLTTSISPGGAIFPSSSTTWGNYAYNYGIGSQFCPPNEAIVGVRGSSSFAGVAQIVLRCAPVTVTGSETTGYTVTRGAIEEMPALGSYAGTPFATYDCPPGMIGSGFRVRSGEILDVIALRCAIPAPPPPTPG